MSTVGSNDNVMANKCLEICQVLVNQGQKFSFSLTIGSNFFFAMDTRMDLATLEARRKNNLQVGTIRKKLSPSQVTRNVKRKEDFLKRKPRYSQKDEPEQKRFYLSSVTNARITSQLKQI